MNYYRLLHLIERIRYFGIVILFQVPAFILLGYVIINAILKYIYNQENFSIIYIDTAKQFVINSPRVIIIWGCSLMLVQLFIKKPILSVKGQYLTHIENIVLIKLNQYQKKGGE